MRVTPVQTKFGITFMPEGRWKPSKTMYLSMWTAELLCSQYLHSAPLAALTPQTPI